MLKCHSGRKNCLFMNKKIEKLSINTDYITLGQFLKFADIIYSGGEAKAYLAQNDVKINGELDNRRGRKLRSGDVIEADGRQFRIE